MKNAASAAGRYRPARPDSASSVTTGKPFLSPGTRARRSGKKTTRKRKKIQQYLDLLLGGVKLRMATQLGDHIQLGCEVVAMDQTTHGATISFRRGQDRYVVHATDVVVAVPVPALRKLTFNPPLPPQTAAAMKAACNRLSRASAARPSSVRGSHRSKTASARGFDAPTC